jgi:predicted alpha/beta-fold hydrolase
MSEFIPPYLLRNRHIQSIFASAGPRRLQVKHRARQLLACSKTVILDGGSSATEQQIQLQGELSLHPQSKGIVTLIHGWEGSANSLYLLSAATELFNAGYSVFRLNLRDHGPTHHLNRELFNSTRVDEVVHALTDLQKYIPQNHSQSQPHFLVGFSLGGNFCLRIGLKIQTPIKKIIAICPVINPAKTSKTLNEGWWVYHRYFVHKWQRSLRKKLVHFPELGYEDILLKLETLDKMNHHFVPNFTPYNTVSEYFADYAIDKNILASLSIPSHLIATQDDPVIDIADLEAMQKPATMTVEVHANGGHCGFINSYSLNSWIDQRIVTLINEAV